MRVQTTEPPDPRFSHISDLRQRLQIYRLHLSSALYRACDKRRVGVLECSLDEISAIEEKRASRDRKPVQTARAAAVKPARDNPMEARAADELPELANVPAPGTSRFTPFLRHDIPDISLFSGLQGGKGKKAADAVGAEVSYTHDRVADNDIWAVTGVAGVAYQVFGDYADRPGVSRVMAAFVAPYVQVEKVFNTNAALSAKNSDTVTVGLMGEVGINNLWGGDQYFRLGGAGVFDNIGDTKSVSIRAEWIPVYDRFIHHPEAIPGTNVLYRFDPSLIAQFDSTTDSTAPLLFSGQEQAFRIGPQFLLFLKPVPHTMGFLSNFHANLTYHVAYEAYSDQWLHWFQSALTYNLTPNVGFSAIYKVGSDENTGKQVDSFKLALTGKI